MSDINWNDLTLAQLKELVQRGWTFPNSICRKVLDDLSLVHSQLELSEIDILSLKRSIRVNEHDYETLKKKYENLYDRVKKSLYYLEGEE